MKKPVILVTDDDPAICFAFKKTFATQNITTIDASNGNEAIAKIKKIKPDIVFMDIAMPELGGLETLERIKKSDPDLPVIIITGYGSMQTAIRAMQLGAYDYLTKPLDIDIVQITAQRALDMVNMQHQIKSLKRQLEEKTDFSDCQLIGKNAKMQDIYKKIGIVSTTPNATNILILGDTGTGKELAARAIHNNGPNSNEPFIAINCTVLPENLLESELFGHEKGAFTGADHVKPGKFELAGNGTLFLDEIGDMPVSLQKKLLRVIQERSFERLGGNKLISLHARIISATHLDLIRAMQKKLFRKDLYYRLNVFEIVLPPIRQRMDDIPLLANYFLMKYNERFGKKISHFSPAVLDLLFLYDFPGNVRELENIIERAVVLERSSILTQQSLPQDLLQNNSPAVLDIPILDENFSRAKRIVTETFEKKFLSERLIKTGGNVSEAARLSGLERKSYQRLMKKYNMSSEDFKHR